MLDLLTVAEVQKVLRVSRLTVMKLIHDGKLRAFKVGSAWRIEREAINDLRNPA